MIDSNPVRLRALAVELMDALENALAFGANRELINRARHEFEAEAMMTCEECGLPLAICNTLAAYRKAVEFFAKNNTELATEFLNDAKDYYEQYRAERDARKP